MSNNYQETGQGHKHKCFHPSVHLYCAMMSPFKKITVHCYTKGSFIVMAPWKKRKTPSINTK